MWMNFPYHRRFFFSSEKPFSRMRFKPYCVSSEHGNVRIHRSPIPG
ncbi:hypothetical protein D3OALGA1CA_5455 [Olavius algarvensis associated proteobacterium Delta 3]|nr:hypothetical protein D3OALGB2SA_3746 [Olavius algarvensis associated proteobacterium Delta 3]CAB5167158.1 hypothetical protein D3OALGA1CA_5455 [Olavius algarvensis associated proteobacterium Delta 3]